MVSLRHRASQGQRIALYFLTQYLFHKHNHLNLFLLLKKYNLGFYEDESGALSKSILSAFILSDILEIFTG